MRPLLLSILFTASAFAQGTATPTPSPTATANATRNLWTCTLPGGTYQVLVSAILSVSIHEYVVDGAARVTEVNVDTSGQFAVRFYFLEPAIVAGPGGLGAATIGKVQSMITEAGERSGTDAWKKVVKSYPTTTHARTIEFRVNSRESLAKIFTSAANCQATGRPEKVTLQD